MQQAIDILDKMINELMKLSTREFTKKDPINLLEEAKSRIQALGDGWIPVTERLPNPRQEVLAFFHTGSIYISTYLADSNNWIAGDDRVIEPLFWMPLQLPHKQ